MNTTRYRVLEHAQQYGMDSLSDADLLFLALNTKGTSTKREKLLSQIKALLQERDEVNRITHTEAGELLAHGFDLETATRLQALFALARRLIRPNHPRYQITSAKDAVQYVAVDLRYLDHEEMRVLVLDTQSQVVANVELYKGTVDSSVVRVAELFRPAITRACPRIILCHNHPSGNPRPSPEDIAVTRQVVEAGKVLEIELLDHIIIGNPSYTSLKELMNW